MWLVEQFDDGRNAVVHAHGVLCQLGVLVTAGEVAQGAGGGLSYILLISGTHQCMDQSLHTVVLAYKCLVTGIIARQIWQGARDTSQHVYVLCGEEVNQNLQQPFQVILHIKTCIDLNRGTGQDGNIIEIDQANLINHVITS